MSPASLTVGVLTFLLAISPQENRFQGPTAQTSLPMSPSVLATFIAHGEPLPFSPGQPPPVPPTGPLTLDLLVLWRGAPGWYLKGGHSAASGGGDDKGHVNVQMQRGGVELDLTLDRQKGVAVIAGNEVVLDGANVVLVDGVGVPGGLTFAGTGSVDPKVEDLKTGAYAVLRGAPDLIPFLRCEVRVEDPGGRGASAGNAYLQQAMDAAMNAGCARILAK
jgi:hypothetical protein